MMLHDVSSDRPAISHTMRRGPTGNRTATWIARAAVAAVAIATGLVGCIASRGTAPSVGYRERAQTQVLGGVQASAAALSAEESEAEYGVPLARMLIQPVWIEVVNQDDRPYWLMFAGLDPNYLPASEAAEAMARGRPGGTDVELESRFQSLAFRNPVRPGETVSGFVLTDLHEGVKLLQLDLFADRSSRSFSFMTIVPGLRADYDRSIAARRRFLADVGINDVEDDVAFRSALEALPCCVTNKDGSRNGDPLNLVIVGGVGDAFPALVRRGWSPTEVAWTGSVMRMVRSALTRDRYAYAPVSNLYLYGRPQDLALQKARDNINQRNHLRLWRSPMNYRGQPVWVGQISRDIGSRLTIHSPTLTTHKIDPDVDGAAQALVEDLVYSQGLRAIGHVPGVGNAPKSAPRRNLTLDPYHTNGLRTVLIFDDQPTSLADIEFLPWDTGGLEFLEPATDEGGP